MWATYPAAAPAARGRQDERTADETTAARARRRFLFMGGMCGEDRRLGENRNRQIADKCRVCFGIWREDARRQDTRHKRRNGLIILMKRHVAALCERLSLWIARSFLVLGLASHSLASSLVAALVRAWPPRRAPAGNSHRQDTKLTKKIDERWRWFADGNVWRPSHIIANPIHPNPMTDVAPQCESDRMSDGY